MGDRAKFPGRYQQVQLLGEGNFAKVYLARHMDTKQEVAIKVMDKEKLIKLGAVHQIKREIAVMRRLRHPNIVQLHKVMACKSRIFVVMEYVRGGPLYRHVPVNGGMKEDEARRIFQQLVSALTFCHAQGVYHRDIKPDNLLVDEHGNLKVADFGLSAHADTARQEAILHTVCGTPLYVAPEVFLRKGYDGAKADAWSCGIVLFVLAAGRKPFRDDDLRVLYRTICRGDFRCPRSFSPELVRIVRRLLQPNPTHRITLLQIMETDWFKKGFKEISFYIDKKDCLRSLDGPEEPDFCDSDSDDETVMSPDSSSPVAQAQGMHTSISAPSLVNLEKMHRSASRAPQTRLRRIKSMNAFDIIASSPSFDLSGLFEERGEQMRFVSSAPVATIIAKLEEIAGQVSFTARTKDSQVSFEATRNGHKGALAISAKILQLTPEIVMVQVSKKAGDTAEYHQFCSSELKPGLRGLVDGLPEEGLPPALSVA
ncbi:CBL-interacting protein kinase 25-like [Lolium rigidum]|uniref:CBL-interacting protein kinase 25-like n=1 Tax=Lolium rigidum TaxID=89674 RepID=UPI001F5D441D|nr:CBL-interacting protein kinase 25-like [Lolium rigidum]